MVVRFDGRTRRFLEKELKKAELNELASYIGKTVSVRRRRPSLKLAILEKMADKKAFIRRYGQYHLPPHRMRLYRQELRRRTRARAAMKPRKTKTYMFLTTDPELGLGNGYPVLAEYIVSKQKNWSVPKDLPENIKTKLDILKGMIDRDEFSRKKGGYYLSPSDIEHYRKLYRSTLAQKETPKKVAALPPKPLANPWMAVLASLPVDEKDWNKVPSGVKVRLAKRMGEEWQRFALNKAYGIVEPKVEPQTLIAFAVGDKSAVEDAFLKHAFEAFQDMRSTSLMKDEQKAIAPIILKWAEKKTWADVKGRPREKLMDEHETESVPDLNLLISDLKHISPERKKGPELILPKWAEPLPEKTPVRKWWEKLPKMKQDRLRNQVLWAAETIFGLKLDFKGLNPPEGSLFKMPAAKKRGQEVFREAFVISTLENLWTIRKLSNLGPRDYYGSMLSAHAKACRQLENWTKEKEAQILAQKGAPKRKKAVA